ncbi:MAG: ATP-binding protein [Rhizomicrobium sp.]
MRNGIFVEGLSNVERMLAGIRTLASRGAPEASWLLNEGDPGYGKSKSLQWYAMRERSIFVRAKADWTPNWMLRDIADALGVQPSRRTETLFNSVLAELMQRQCAIIVDEIDHAARSIRVLETLRDLTDASEVPLIAGGMKGALAMLRRYQQIRSRIADVVTFGPASEADVKAICKELTDVQIADDLVAEICKRTGGRLRDVMNAIARIEARMKNSRSPVTIESWGGKPLTNEDRVRPQLVKVAANG